MVKAILSILFIFFLSLSELMAEENPSLRIESAVEAPQLIYPGQRLKLIYRIYYVGGISLTEENLPFLEAKDFLKIGSVQVVERKEKDVNVQEITQEVEATAPGTYLFPGAYLEGYRTIAHAKPQPGEEKIIAKTDSVSVIVQPFPTNGIPPAFNGAVGKFDIASQLSSSATIRVGDNIVLDITITGTGDLDKVNLPLIYCQPGFSGFFDLSTAPPPGVIEGGKKNFRVNIRPLSDIVDKVPSIIFAYFDPATAQYHIVKTKEIPIRVRDALATVPATSNRELLPTPAPPTVDEKKESNFSFLDANYVLVEANLYGSNGSIKLAIYLTLIAVALLMLQKAIKKWIVDKKLFYWQREDVILLRRAKALMQQENNSVARDESYRLIEKALFLAVQEVYHLSALPQSPDELHQDKLMQEVHDFLQEVEKARFMKKQVAMQEMILKAEFLLKRLIREKKHEFQK